MSETSKKSLFEMFDPMDDSTERYEAFMECCLSEINSDDEPYRKKGRALAIALMRNNADEAVVALCGWSAKSIAKKAMLIRDDQKMFHTEPIDAEITVCYGDGESASSVCKVCPQTHEVHSFDESVFHYSEKPITSVVVWLAPVEDLYQFVCIDATAMPENPAAFWYKVQK